MSELQSASHRHVIDALRAIAALSVCLFHFAGQLDFHGQAGQILHAISSRGHLGVAVFFVVSGYVIPLSMRDWRLDRRSLRTFMGRRLLRLYPPYLVASLLVMFLWICSSFAPVFRGPAPTIEPWGLIGNLTLTADLVRAPWILVVAWTLAIEAQFYFAIALALPFLASSSTVSRLGALTAWILLPAASSQAAFLGSHAALFGMGITAFLMIQQRLALGQGVLFLMLSTAVQAGAHDWESSLVGLVTAAVLFVPAPEWRISAYLGAISYSLYLIHVPIGGRVVNLAKRLPDFPGRNFSTVLAAFACSLVVADVFHRFVERPWIARSREFGRLPVGPLIHKPIAPAISAK